MLARARIQPLLGFSVSAYLAIFLWLAAAGPGVVSIDHALQQRRYASGGD